MARLPRGIDRIAETVDRRLQAACDFADGLGNIRCGVHGARGDAWLRRQFRRLGAAFKGHVRIPRRDALPGATGSKVMPRPPPWLPATGAGVNGGSCDLWLSASGTA